MTSKYLLALWAGATLVVGKTPSGFTPNSDTDLILLYGQMPAMNGVVVDKAGKTGPNCPTIVKYLPDLELATASTPTIATKSRLDGTSYAVIMVDLDIPSDQNPHNFLHWMQTGLTPATKASTITASNGSTQAFTLSNDKNTSAIVAYTQPAPPAQNPLSHRYTEILVDTSSMSAEGLSALQSAAETRVGFDTKSVLEAAGLSNNVVAGNSFNVTNAGPATSSTSTGGSNSTSSGTGNDQKSGQDTKSSNGTASVNQAGTLTSTISSAPGGATAGSWTTVTAADKNDGDASAASRALGGDFMLTVSLITGVGFTTAFVLSL